MKEQKAEYNDLLEVEQFGVKMSIIKGLVPRVMSLLFQQRFPQLVQDSKPQLLAVHTACEEIKTSRKFAKLLEIILVIGNIMNSGSKNAQALGFNVNYLPKV